MTFPAGAMLLFLGACPSGWAPPPTWCGQPQSPGAWTCSHTNEDRRITPDGAQWCVKQPEIEP